MNNKVYYGQYSLRHWINLILKKNIILPEYQRHFAWNEEKVDTLINSLKENQFIPPVTIGKFHIGNEDHNLILDGQQRLTSIFLAYLCKFPNFATKTIADVTNNQNKDDDSTADPHQWTFEKLTELGTSKEKIIKSLPPNQYKEINHHLNDDFFDEKFIGFAYLVPSTDDKKEQLKYYSSVFRNINIRGVTLLQQESRASLYFLDKDLSELFSPNFCNTIGVKNLSTPSKLDFVRALALTSQYKKDRKSQHVAAGYKSNMEMYYEEYIYSVVNDEDGDFGKFSSIFPECEYKTRLDSLADTLKSLGAIRTDHSSIIDLDIFIIGAIYHIFLCQEKLDPNKIDQAKEKLISTIEELKGNEDHRKSPGNLNFLRLRIEKSIEAYKDALQKTH